MHVHTVGNQSGDTGTLACNMAWMACMSLLAFLGAVSVNGNWSSRVLNDTDKVTGGYVLSGIFFKCSVPLRC